jgi:hypothetical protein
VVGHAWRDRAKCQNHHSSQERREKRDERREKREERREKREERSRMSGCVGRHVGAKRAEFVMHSIVNNLLMIG